MRGNREAKALTKTLYPYRSGSQGQLRAEVRCMLVRLMGFAQCEDIPTGIGKIPHHFPRRSGFDTEEMFELALVAEDGLRELGYDAAAAMLMRWIDRAGGARGELHVEIGAKDALSNLEGGPPSVMLDYYPIITKTIRHYVLSNGAEYVVGRKVDDPRGWYRFAKGRSVHDQRGQYVGWDSAAGYTFQRRGDSLEDVFAAKYGSAALG